MHYSLPGNKRDDHGFTLIEIMMATAIMTVVMGMLVGLSISFGDTTEVQDISIITSDEARRAILTVTPELRQSARMSINFDELPGDSITYRVADDSDNNGSAVSAEILIELSAARTIQRDVDDLNEDGLTTTQLILINGDALRVLANDLNPLSETLDAQGVLQDTDGDGKRDLGFWVESFQQGLLLTFETQRTTRRGHDLSQTTTGFVVPRN